MSWCGNTMKRHNFSIVSTNRPKLCGNCAFLQNFHTKKLGENYGIFRSDCYLSKVAHLDSSLHKKRSFPLKISLHCVKSVQIRSFSWSEYRKIRTRKNSVFGHFLRSVSNPYWKTLNGKETLNIKLHFLCFASWIHINCFFLIYTSARYILAATIWIKQILLIIIHHTSTHQSWMLY